MNQITMVPCWVRGSKIEEIIWIGKDVLVWCTGLYIVFFHVVQRQQTLHWCWSNVNADGARCISGHVSLPIFAFSERSLNPRIFILAYPSMTKICECVQGCVSGYLAIAFTLHDHIVSLGSHPNFPMILWCWRTGQKIATVDTSIRDEVGQIIRVTSMGHTVIGQMGKTCGRLLTWEPHVVGKIVFLKEHEVKLPKEAMIHGISWCPTQNPLLAITDLDGHIYLSNYDGTDVHRIVVSQRCGVCIDIELPVVCWFREGIILRTTFCQIRYFKKDPKTNVWHKQWYIKSIYKPCILVAHPYRNDWLFYYTLEGHLMQMVFPENTSAPTIYRHLHFGSKYHFVDFLYPWCHHLVVTDDLEELTILESYSGSEVSKIELNMEGTISAQASHPDDPLVVVVSNQGEMTVLGVTDPEQPSILAYFRLQRKPLDLIKFSLSGKFLIAAQKETSNCYCINLRRDKPWSVIAQLQTKRRLADVVLYDDEARGSLKVLVLIVKYERFSLVGQEFLVYDVSLDHPVYQTEANNSVMLPGLFCEMCHAPGNNPNLLLGSLYLKRQLQRVHLPSKNDFEKAALIDVTLTGHHVRMARVFANRRWIVTCAYDGLVIIRDETVHKIVTALPAHHRLDSGTRKAIVNSNGDMVIALGHDGSLVAIRICYPRESEALLPTIGNDRVYQVDYGWYEKQKEKILSDYTSLDPLIRASLTRDKQRIPEASEKRTWTEWWSDIQLENETKLYAVEKAVIERDLAILKATLKQLLDVNETRSEMEKLPISAFDMDKVGRDQKMKNAKDEREEVRMEIERYCISMDRVAAWIKRTFWDSQIVLGRSIFSFSGDLEVTNYPLVEDDPYFKDRLRWAQFMKESVHNITGDDTFVPWGIYTDDELQKKMSEPIRVYHEDERRRINILLEEDEREVVPEEDLHAFDGITTYRFVEQSPYHYSQIESYGFEHVTLNELYLMHDYSKLRAYFNVLFDDMYAAKEREMKAIREKNERIRHIDAELRIMFDQSVPRVPFDPQWHHKEELENIIQVFSYEIKAKAHITPSQQEVLDLQAMEMKRLEELFVKDGFRELALIKMMDGVLEIRWEDTIKLDVRKPACMLEKQPEQYTAEDIIIVKKYEADVETLRQERERYKRMLEADYAKVSGQLQEGIDKFDSKLNDFFQLKLKVEAALNQLKLRHIRGRLRNLARIEDVRGDDRIKREIDEKRQYEIVLQEHLQKLNDVYQDMLAQHDAFSTRDKVMAKKLQQDFSVLVKVNIELLEKQYKRRPKVSLKNTAAKDLIILAKYIGGHMKLSYLPTECAEYFRVLENLDVKPTGLPQSIDANQWDHLIRSRRQKIEMELTIKAKQLEIALVEKVIATFENKIDMCRSSAELLRDQLKSARDERVVREQDVEMQLVLKMGQVEIELRGDLNDTANAILVPRSEIEKVNEHIFVAGARKLEALKRMIDFQHGTSYVEWEHRCLKMRFEELEEDLRFVKDMAVTRDMRIYLKRMAKGLRDDKTAVHLEKEIEMTKKSLEKSYSNEMSKVENLRQKIECVKKRNAELDRNITEMNVARWELEHQRDIAQETRQNEHMKRKMCLFKLRSDLVRKLQSNYAELLELQIEHELWQLKTRPMLQYCETLDDKSEDC